MTEHEELLISARYQPTTVGNMALDPKGGYCNYQAVEILRQRVQELTAERDKATQYWQIAEGRCDALKLTLNTFQQAVEHVTENGSTRRAFSTSEGWAMIHKHRLLDLEIIEERCDAMKQHLEDFESDIDTCTQHNVELQLEVIKLNAERDNWKQAAQNNHDRLVDVQAELELSDALQRDRVATLTAERDELLEVVETAYKVASEHNDRLPFDWAVYCEMLYQTIASVKEKS